MKRIFVWIFMMSVACGSAMASGDIFIWITAKDQAGQPVNGAQFRIVVQADDCPSYSCMTIDRTVKTGAAKGWDGRAGLQVAPYAGAGRWTVTPLDSSFGGSKAGTYPANPNLTVNLDFVKAGTPPPPPPPPPPGKRSQGYLDHIDCNSAWGWGTLNDLPNTAVAINIVEPMGYYDRWIGSAYANQYREDLKRAGKGNGIHGFTWTPPSWLKDGRRHSLSFRVTSTKENLVNSPAIFQCR